MLAGMFNAFVTCLICSTAAPSEAPGARLKESVTMGNWLWWLIVIGDGILAAYINDLSGAGGSAGEHLAVDPLHRGQRLGGYELEVLGLDAR